MQRLWHQALAFDRDLNMFSKTDADLEVRQWLRDPRIRKFGWEGNFALRSLAVAWSWSSQDSTKFTLEENRWVVYAICHSN